MFKEDFERVINTHPEKVVASYNGATTLGIFREIQEKLFTDEKSHYNYKYYEFTYVSENLTLINSIKVLTINGKNYTITDSDIVQKYLSRLTLQAK